MKLGSTPSRARNASKEWTERMNQVAFWYFKEQKPSRPYRSPSRPRREYSPWRRYAPPEPMPRYPLPKRIIRPAPIPRFGPVNPWVWVPRFGARAATRLIPFLGWGLLAYDLYELFDEYWHRSPALGDVRLPAGWRQFCFQTVPSAPKGIGWANVPGPDPWKGYCGLGGQVPEWIVADMSTAPDGPMTSDNLFMGEVTLAPINGDIETARYRIRKAWAYYGPNVPHEPFVNPGRFHDPNAYAPPEPAPDFLPAPEYFIPPRVQPRHPPLVDLKPYQEPAVQFEPGTPPQFVPHNRARPEKGKREKKTIVILKSKAVGKAGEIFGMFTEADDFIGAVWKTLPRKYQTKGATPDQKVRDIWRNLDEVDWANAIYNVAENQIQDNVLGRLGQAGASITKNQYWVSPVSPETGAQRRFQQVKVKDDRKDH